MGQEVKKTKRKIVSLYKATKKRLRPQKYSVLDNRVIVGTHHKTGTVWLKRIFQKICADMDLEFFAGTQIGVPDDNDIFFQSHSIIDFDKIEFDFRGLHIIRDPRDKIISGCFYHQKSGEPWLHSSKEEFGGLTYQEKIKSFSKFEDKLLFEMENAGSRGVQEMLDWDYENPKNFEVKYEDLILDENLLLFHRIFNHLGFQGAVIPDTLRIAYENSLFSGNIKKSTHVRSGSSSQWVEHFSPAVRERFDELFPEALVRLGYESDDCWVKAD